MSGHRQGVDALAATVERLHRELELARSSAAERALVGTATGILVERGHGSPAQAARYMRQLARAARQPLPELAADIVNAAAGDEFAGALPATVTSSAGKARVPAAVLRTRAAEAGMLAGDAQAVAESILGQALAPLGAAAAAVWTTSRDGALTLAGHAGFPQAEADRWRHVPPGVGVLAQQAVDRCDVLWYEKPPDGVPGIGRRAGLDGARALLPARIGGRILGVLEACWSHPQPPPAPAVRRQLDALAELCAHTLPGTGTGPESSAAGQRDGTPDPLADLADGLLDPAMVLRPVAGERGETSDFEITHTNDHFTDPAGRGRSAVTGTRLLEAYPLLARDGSLYQRVLRVHATGEPFRAERMPLPVLVDRVPVTVTAAVGMGRYGEAVLLSWRIEDETTRLAALLRHAQRLGRIGGFEEDAITGEVIWSSQLFSVHGLPPTSSPIPLEQLHRHAHPDDAVAIGRFVRTLLHHRRPASTAFRLRRADGVIRHIRVIAEPVTDTEGDLLAVRGACQDVSAQHWTEVALAATRDELAATEQRAAERNRLALRLQQAIMPPAPPAVEELGLRVVARYRPAEEEHLVGGDWYDAVQVSTERMLLAVGDVAGHGIAAATGMVVLRNALRGLAATGAGPARLLGWLNTAAYHLPEQITATVVCGLYDSRTRVLRWARAGHLPPVLVRRGRPEVLPMPSGVLLGAVDRADYEEEQLTLEAGDRLLMYTDGLIERRDCSVERSLEHLLTAARTPVPDLDECLDRLLTHSRADTDDDTCLVGVQLG